MWRQIKPIKKALAKNMRSKPTRSEEILWQALRAHRFHGLHFRRQHVIQGYIVDFYCAELRLIIEIDGEVHNSQIEEDKGRQQALEGLGLGFWRVSSSEVESDLNSVLSRLKTYLQENGLNDIIKK